MTRKSVLSAVMFLVSSVMVCGLSAQSSPDRIRLWGNGSVVFTAPLERIDSVTFASSVTPDPQDEDGFRLSKYGVRMPVSVYDVQTASDVPNTDRFTVFPANGTYRVAASSEGVVTWQISDSEVTLTAVGTGRTTLTVTQDGNDFSAEYEVEVVSVLESLTFTQAFLNADVSDAYLSRLDTVDSVFIWTSESGGQVALRAFLIDVTLDLFSDGFYVDEHYAYAGSPSGYIASFPGRMWYSPAGMNSDRGFDSPASVTMGVWNTQSMAVSKVLKAGTYVNGAEAFEHVRLAVESFNRYVESSIPEDLNVFQKEMLTADTMAFKGARLIRAKYFESLEGYGWDFMPAAVITSGFIRLAEPDKYGSMYSVPEAEMNMIPLEGDNGWGVKVMRNELTKQYTVVSDGFEFGEAVHYHHSTANGWIYAPMRETVRPGHRALTALPADDR